MKVMVNHELLKIHFKYDVVKRSVKIAGMKSDALCVRTRCVISTIQDNCSPSAISVGESVCLPPDRFVKDTGRKQSLTDALFNLTTQRDFDRDSRRVVWQAYLGRK